MFITDQVMDLVSIICKYKKEYALYLAFEFDVEDLYENVMKAATFLRTIIPLEDQHKLFNGWLAVFFDTKEEAVDAYNTVVGDDGPTEQNTYDPGEEGYRVYALLMDNRGQSRRENT